MESFERAINDYIKQSTDEVVPVEVDGSAEVRFMPDGSYRTIYNNLQITAQFVSHADGQRDTPRPLTLTVGGEVRARYSIPAGDSQSSLTISSISNGLEAAFSGWQWTDGRRILRPSDGQRHLRNQQLVTDYMDLLADAVSNITTRVRRTAISCDKAHLVLGNEHGAPVLMHFDRISSPFCRAASK
jgi:hypothetical protein